MIIIFDFDGTICDSIPQAVEIANKILEKFNVAKTSIKEVRGIGVKGVLQKRKVTPLQLIIFVKEFRKEQSKFQDSLKPFKSIPKVLERLDKKNSLGILTSNSIKNVTKFLQKFDMDKYFQFVISDKQIFGKHVSLKKIIKKNDFDKNKVIYVGDETRDIEAAKKVGVNPIAVTWGAEQEKLLLKSKPYKIINKPEALMGITS